MANAYDLTMTHRGLEPHSDNPYRDPIRGYIWLHCLSNAAEGGDNTLMDGYQAALVLRDHPAYARTVRFCDDWDQTSFDPDYDTLPLAHFVPMVERVLARPPFGGLPELMDEAPSQGGGQV